MKDDHKCRQPMKFSRPWYLGKKAKIRVNSAGNSILGRRKVAKK